MEEHINNWENCEYCERSYYEYDTGYAEYSCSLLGYECIEQCPLSFKFRIEV